MVFKKREERIFHELITDYIFNALTDPWSCQRVRTGWAQLHTPQYCPG